METPLIFNFILQDNDEIEIVGSDSSSPLYRYRSACAELEFMRYIFSPRNMTLAIANCS